MGDIIRLRLLGPVQIERESEPVRGFESRKALALLGHLAVQRQPVSRSQLVELFWPDKSEARGRGNLSRVLHNLSTLLPGCLAADYYSLQIQPGPTYWVDIYAFDELTAQKDIGALAAAADLYRGDLMADIYLDDSPQFETWLVAERERWQQRVIQVLRKLIKHHTYHRQYDQALSFASRLLALAPWLEEAHRQMMLLLARSGQRSAALTQYQICCQRLAEELAVEPSAETWALYERIRAAGSPARPNLPAQPTPFVGREVELAEVSRLIEAPNCRLLTMIGPGGIGKTRLALQAASQVTSQGFVAFLNGVYFVSLAGIDSEDLVAPTIADALRLPLYGALDPKIQLLNYLRGKEMLLILDNFEHLLDATGLLVDILQQAPDVKLIVTSRVRLNLRWEWLLDLHGLDVPRLEDLDDPAASVEKHSALRLFAEIAGRVRRSFSLARNKSCVARICQLVQGMPLGIELAAAGVRERSCEVIAGEIEHNLDSLSTSLQDLPARHRSMRAVFDYSWGFLSQEERRVFSRLSVFRGGFQLDAAERVAGATVSLLSALVDKSFLRRSSSERYGMHELLRQYAAGKLERVPEEYKRVNDLHCVYYTGFLSERELTKGGDQKKTITEIGEEIGNIRASRIWAVEHERVEEIRKALNALWTYYEIQGLLHEGEATFGWAASKLEKRNQNAVRELHKDAVSREGLDRVAGQALVQQAWFKLRLGHYLEAKDINEKALARLQHAVRNASSDVAFSLYQLGMISWYLGDFKEAEHYIRESIKVSQEIDNLFFFSLSIQHLGAIKSSLGEYSEAQELHRDALNIFDRMGERRGVSTELSQLGKIACVLGDYTKAEELLQESLAISSQLEDRFGCAVSLSYLGILAYERKQYLEAKQRHQDSLDISEPAGDQWAVALSLTHLGYATCALGEYQEAERYLHRTVRLAMEVGLISVSLAALLGVANLLLSRGQQQRALEVLAVVLDHPASEQETKDRAEELLSELESQLPRARAMVAAQARGKGRKLEEVVAEILGG